MIRSLMFIFGPAFLVVYRVDWSQLCGVKKEGWEEMG